MAWTYRDAHAWVNQRSARSLRDCDDHERAAALRLAALVLGEGFEIDGEIVCIVSSVPLGGEAVLCRRVLLQLRCEPPRLGHRASDVAIVNPMDRTADAPSPVAYVEERRLVYAGPPAGGAAPPGHSYYADEHDLWGRGLTPAPAQLPLRALPGDAAFAVDALFARHRERTRSRRE